MHPAYSVIVFTTVSGLGYGLAAVLGLGLLDPSQTATKLAHFAALALISAGLLSSTLHLRNPQRAWRAFSQWRSSWLSREGVLSIATFVPLCAGAWLAIFESRHVPWIGATGAILAAATVYCTSMIYASLKSVQAWHTPLTSACYLLFAFAGGLLLATVFAALSGSQTVLMIVATAIALAGAWIVKAMWRVRLATMAPLSTPESATGLGSIGHVRLLERPHVTENYLTREMGFKVARKHAAKLAWLSALLGGALPVLLLVVSAIPPFAPDLSPWLIVSALLSHVVGMLTERWLFFAEARHAVMNYYGG
ncbi:MAG: DmsC/YnfH family molybdoenzyme membrane anchor subunit [Rhizobiaceae bacterium]